MRAGAMRLKLRLALVVMVLMLALVLSYSGVLLAEVRDRADAETEGALPWVLALLPDTLPASSPATETTSPDAGRTRLVELVQQLGGIRHVRITLFDPAGRRLATAPSVRRPVPAWLERKLPPARSVRKEVRLAGTAVAYFEVEPATSDELGELWGDFLRGAGLVVFLSSLAGSLIVWFTFAAFAPVERIRHALRAIGSGQPHARLPAFRAPEMNDIALAFNRMAMAVETAQSERSDLMRRLVEGDEQARRALAHDLHDELSPYLVALQPLTRLLELRCAAAPELADVARSVHQLMDHQSHILRTLRRILTGLHPPELETLGLRAAIEQTLSERAERGGRRLRIDLRIQGDLQGFGPTMDVSIYRMVQECVTNALRHGSGSVLALTIAVYPAELSLHGAEATRRWVRIDAVNRREAGAPAFDRPAGLGYGMSSMRERSVALGGSCDAGPVQDEWRVCIRLPLGTEAAAGAEAVA